MKTLSAVTRLFEKYESVWNVESYYGLLSIWALAEQAVETHDDKSLARCKHLLSLYPDQIQHPAYNFEVYRVGGNGKAWLLYQGLFDEEKEIVRKYAEITLASDKDDEGIVCLKKDGRCLTWIDVAHCISPYMLYAGLAFGNPAYVDFAAEQTIRMYERFLDRSCGLLHQAKGFLEDPESISRDHWGRGNGWGYFSLTILVRDLPENHKDRSRVEKYYKDLSYALLKYQNHHGVWRQEIDCEYAWDESSATAFIAFGIGVGLRLGLLEKEVFDGPFRRAVKAMTERFIDKDFSTEMCCSGCLCPGEGEDKGTAKAYVTEKYPQTNDPHSFAPMMFALTEAFRHGMTDLDKW